jgi:hypothetical protein
MLIESSRLDGYIPTKMERAIQEQLPFAPRCYVLHHTLSFLTSGIRMFTGSGLNAHGLFCWLKKDN